MPTTIPADNPAVDSLVAGSPAVGSSAPVASPAGSPHLEAYFSTLAAADAPAATSLVLDLLSEGTPLSHLAEHVLTPAQVRVGECWESGRWSVADEHAATAVTEAALAALTSAAPRSTPPPAAPRIVLACAEGEWHTLPARLAHAVAGMEHVTLLSTPRAACDLAEVLRREDASLLALSCTVATSFVGAARCIEAAHAIGVPVLAGGRAFGSSPERAERLGADAWAPDASALLGVIPPLRSRPTSIPAEVLSLEALPAETLEFTAERLVAGCTHLPPIRPLARQRLPEELRWVLRFAAAAVLVEDVSVLTEYLRPLRLCTPAPSWELTATAALLLADVVEADAPLGAEMLRRAAQRECLTCLPRGAGVSGGSGGEHARCDCGADVG